MTYRAAPRPEGARAKFAWSVVTAIAILGTIPTGVAVAVLLAFVVIGSAVAIGNGPGRPPRRE